MAREDVLRLDRLIGDISEAARTDAELARAAFEEVDLGPLIEQLVTAWENRREKGDARIAFARPRRQSAVVLGKPDRLARAIDNIIDNAIGFSPPFGLSSCRFARWRQGADQDRRRCPGVPARPVKRFSTLSFGTWPAARISAAIASAWRSPAPCSKAHGEIDVPGPRRACAIGRALHYLGCRRQCLHYGAAAQSETLHAALSRSTAALVLISGPSGSASRT